MYYLVNVPLSPEEHATALAVVVAPVPAAFVVVVAGRLRGTVVATAE